MSKMTDLNATPIIVPTTPPNNVANTIHSPLPAFLFGAFLSVFAWLANQMWILLSLFLFGPFEWSANSAWPHIVLCSAGSIVTSIAWCSVFTAYFPEHTEVGDDDIHHWKYQQDVSSALQDLGELGFMIGYLTSHYFGVKVISHLKHISTNYDNGIDFRVMFALLLLWIILSKIKDFVTATKRARRYESTDAVYEARYVRLV